MKVVGDRLRRTGRPRGLDVVYEAHPPERRRRRGQVAACGCCCCCCCLHTVGGLIGPAVAGRSKSIEEHSATVTYWLCLLAAILLSGLSGPLLFGEHLGGLLSALLVLPGYQLVASLVSTVIVAATTGSAGLGRIWRITWRGLVGALVGFVIMVFLFQAMKK